MGPVNQSHAVEQEETFHGRSLGGLSRRVQKSARLESEEEFQPQKGAKNAKIKMSSKRCHCFTPTPAPVDLHLGAG